MPIHITGPNQNISIAAQDVQRIGYQSYIESDWLDQIARENNADIGTLANEVFDVTDPEKALLTRKRLEASALKNDTTRFAFARLDQDVSPFGFALIKAEPIYDDTKAPKEVNPSIVNIYGLCVAGELRKGVAGMLVDYALSDLQEDLPVSFFTSENNDAMRGWGEKHAFEEDTSMSEDLESHFGEIVVPYVRYTAKTVQSVRATL